MARADRSTARPCPSATTRQLVGNPADRLTAADNLELGTNHPIDKILEDRLKEQKKESAKARKENAQEQREKRNDGHG